MKNVLWASNVLIFLFLLTGVAMGNPNLLPNHPGYPAKGTSPVTGQSLANDPGKSPLPVTESLHESTEFYDEVSKIHATEKYPNVVSPTKDKDEAHDMQRSSGE